MWNDTNTGRWTKTLTGPSGRIALDITTMAGGRKYQWTIWAYDAADRSIFHAVGMSKSRERAELMIEQALRRAQIETGVE